MWMKTGLPPSRRVLLADDDHAVRMLLGQIIGTFGFDVTYADNGKVALQTFDATPDAFDLLITDICMPEMNGSELVHAIRQRDQNLPIIVVTGYADSTLVAEIHACNAKLFQKPVNFEALRAYIHSL